MLIDGSHKAWCWATLTLFVLASGAYFVYARSALDGPRGGSVPGLIFGIVGSALMIYAGLISARKKAPAWRIGSAQTWLRGHLWLGSLSISLILFHAGFRWGGPVEQALLWILAAIVASGVFGLVLQQFLPRQMTARVPLETFYAQVPHVCRVLELEADVAVAQLCGPLPLAIDEHDDVATVERLNQLGVSGKNPLAAVYAPASAASEAPARKGKNPDAEQGRAADAEKDALKATAVMREVREAPDPTTMPKPVSAADKIAMMRAAKATKKLEGAAAAPAPATSEPAGNAAPEKPKPALSAADKIAMMRSAKAAKKPDEAAAAPAPASSEPANIAADEKAKPALSAADKIAMMRSAKATKKPAESATSLPAAEKPASAAEKIALMRAGKAALAGKPANAAPSAPSPTPAIAPAAKPAPAMRPKAGADDDAWKEARPEFVKFYLEQVRPFLGIDDRRQSLLADGVQAEGQFAAVGAVLPERFRPLVDRLAALCEERRQLAVQVRIHHWLHGWLLLHVPLSLALLALGVVHVIASLYY